MAMLGLWICQLLVFWLQTLHCRQQLNSKYTADNKSYQIVSWTVCWDWNNYGADQSRNKQRRFVSLRVWTQKLEGKICGGLFYRHLWKSYLDFGLQLQVKRHLADLDEQKVIFIVFYSVLFNSLLYSNGIEAFCPFHQQISNQHV